MVAADRMMETFADANPAADVFHWIQRHRRRTGCSSRRRRVCGGIVLTLLAEFVMGC